MRQSETLQEVQIAGIGLNSTSLTLLFITSQARRERKPPATDSNCTIRVATARGLFPQYADMVAGSYTKGKNSLLSLTWKSTKQQKTWPSIIEGKREFQPKSSKYLWVYDNVSKTLSFMKLKLLLKKLLEWTLKILQPQA